MNSPLAQLEALLFVAGDEGVTMSALQQATHFDKPAITQNLQALAQKYAQDDHCSLELRFVDEVYRIVTKAGFGEVIQQFHQGSESATLSQAAMEVLVIVAYQQPITRVEIDVIRGVQSSGTLQKLVLRQLIATVGRKEDVGRPLLYGTTATFLDYFGLQDLSQLPKLAEFEELLANGVDEGELFASQTAQGEN